MVGRELPPNVVQVPRWTLAVHAVQLVFAIIILGLDAYGIHWVAYNALIFSLVVCLCTFAVCIYLVASQLFLHKLYNMYIALAFHIWMLLFWLVDLGLVANLARLWADPSCAYFYGYSYSCVYGKRDIVEMTSYTSYYGALAAGAVFAAAELVLWALCGVFLMININKHRTNTTNAAHASNPPPQYAHNNGQAVPMEKYNQTNTQTQTQPNTQPQYGQPVQQQQYAAPYQQDPVPRQDTVSPVSHAGYAPPSSNVPEFDSPYQTGHHHPNVSELSTPQHTGAGAGGYNAGVSELSNQK